MDVSNIQNDSLLPGKKIAALQLCKAGEAGAHLQPAGLLGRVALRDFKEGRTGADQTHFAAKNVPELGKFVEAPAPQKTAHTRDSRIGC